MVIRHRIVVDNANRVEAQLGRLETKVRRRTVKAAVRAAGKVTYKEAQRIARAEKVTGFFARSIKQDVKTKRGRTTVRIGQAKQKQFKARKTTRAKGKNLSQIQRAGKPVPLHWLEGGTKRHRIRASGTLGRSHLLAFRIGRKTAFAKEVSNPGMRPKHILRRTARRSRTASAKAFENTVAQEINKVR